MNGLFSVGKNEKLLSVFAPVDGKVIPETDIPDVAFSSGMLGEGLGIIPDNGRFVSPVKGTVIDVTSTGHAISLKSDDGAELLLHIGIDTVTLKGEGFDVKVKNGDKIDVGTPLVDADLNLIQSKDLSDICALIIINHTDFSQLTVFEGECKAGSSRIISFVSETGTEKINQ